MLFKTRPSGSHPGSGRAPLVDDEGRQIVVIEETQLLSTGGEAFNPNGATTISYNADGTIAYIQITDGASNYRQTWTWTSGNPTSITGWVKQ